MAYIGTDINYGNIASQTGVGNGTTTPIATLSYSVPTSSSIMVTLDGVTQVPTTDYTAVGTTLTFTSSVASPIAILVYFLGRSLDIGTPADGTVGTIKLVNNAVDETKLKDALISDFSDVTVTASDSFLYGDATDGGNTKKDTIQGILDLVPASPPYMAWQAVVTASTLTAVAGRGYPINTTSNACTITLPASASVGDTIKFVDYARNWETNALTLNQNSLKFQGETSPNPVYNVNGQAVTIVYVDATKGWLPTVDDDVTYETSQAYSIDYLVIAGGGAGGSGEQTGGGGAGGYRNSYNSEMSGGGNSGGEAALEIIKGTVYTITSGNAGASAGAVYGIRGGDGGNASIVGSDITDIISIGGGGGGAYVGAGGVQTEGQDGGSGGGTANWNGADEPGDGTANQGFNGGDADGYGSPHRGGGGGGAGAVGVDGNTGAATGGAGLSSSITGSAVDRGGGGGGGGGPSGGGASHGGGAGAASYNSPGTAGVTNKGGGGGGAAAGSGSANSVGGAGGSGVVILRIPDADYAGASTSGSPAVDTSSFADYTVLTYNGDGTYTA